MPVTKPGIRVPKEFLYETDKILQELKKNRSEVIREAITIMINNYKKQQVVEHAEKIYKEIAEDGRRLADDFMSICEKPVVKYKAGRKTRNTCMGMRKRKSHQSRQTENHPCKENTPFYENITVVNDKRKLPFLQKQKSSILH